MQAEYLALEGLSTMQRLIAQYNASGASDVKMNGILMTMVNANTTLAQDVIAEVREHFGDLVFQTMIPRNVRTSEAPSYGQPVIHYDPTCKGAIAYRAFAKEFIARNPTRFSEAEASVPAEGVSPVAVEDGVQASSADEAAVAAAPVADAVEEQSVLGATGGDAQ
jgi:nitrogenase subunit NifH